MTKWARMRRRKERRRVEETTKHFSSEENETKLAEPEKVSDNVKHSQEKQKLDTPKTSKLNTSHLIFNFHFIVRFKSPVTYLKSFFLMTS